MLYLSAIVYVAVIYIRPAEIVPLLEGAPVVDVLSAVIALVVAGSLLVRPRALVCSAIDGYVLLFWFAIVMSNAAWGWFGGAYKGLLDFAPVVFCYFLIRLALTTPERVRGFVWIFVALNLFLAINGIVQYHTGVGLGNVTTIGAEGRIRGTGIFNDPNDLGMTLVMAVPFLLWIVFERGHRLWLRATGAWLLAPIVTAIVYTNSRGAVLGLCGAVILFSLRQFKTVPALTFGAAAIAGLILLGPSRAQAMDSQENSAQSRIEAWGEGLRMLKSRPLFGVGKGRFTEYHHRVAHNSLVQTAAELGLFGAALFTAMFDGVFRNLRRARRAVSLAQVLPPSWINAMTASAFGMVVCGFFLSRQYVVVPYVMVALGASIDQFTPVASQGAGWSFVIDAARAAVLTVAVLLIVYVMVLRLGAW